MELQNIISGVPGVYSLTLTEDANVQVDLNIQPGQNVQIDCQGFTWGSGSVSAVQPRILLNNFDGCGGIWGGRPPMPTARRSLAAAFDVTNGVLFGVGGLGHSSHSSLNTLEAYDIQNNSWATKQPMPTARRYLVGAFDVTNGVLFAVGGYGSGDYLTTLEAYDVQTDTWTTKQPLALPRAYLAAAFDVTNGVLFAVGAWG
jgi:hypothetical protein